MASCVELRVLLSTLYTVLEAMRSLDGSDDERVAQLREQLCAEISGSGDRAPLALLLLMLVIRFANAQEPHLPVKKLLLCVWKALLLTLGPLSSCFERRNRMRSKFGLPQLRPDCNTEAVRKTISSLLCFVFVVDYYYVWGPSQPPIRILKISRVFELTTQYKALSYPVN